MRGKIIFFENLLALYDNIDLLVNKVNGLFVFRLLHSEREREREREEISGYDDGKGHGRLGVRSMPFPIIVT